MKKKQDKRRKAKRARAGGEAAFLVTYDPREFELPDAGWVELSDAETGERHLVDTSDVAIRVKVSLAAEEQRQRRARALQQAQVDHIALRTDQPYAEELHRVFADRARRLRR